MRKPLAPILLVLAALAPASADAAVGLRSVGTFDEPVYVTSPPGDPSTLAVVERYGRVRLVRDGRVQRRPLLDLRSRVLIRNRDEGVDQRGLLSIAFAPDYATSRRVYVDYVDRSGRVRVDEIRGSGPPRRVLDLGPATTVHHGGQLAFEGGLLYVSTGIGDTPKVSQDPAAPGGKVLRLDPAVRPARPEVYALGLRNPWRFSFDRGTLFIGDVGEDAAEEIDVVPAGAEPGTNFGWPAFEGRTRRAAGAPAGLTAPALVRSHGAGWCSIVGGYVVRDLRLPALRGRYVYGDVCSGRMHSARVSGSRLVDDRRLRLRVPYLVSFGEDGLGRLHAVSLTGRVWRLEQAGR